jgi:GPH family glycoside/pentoside/hexuronide:cation symporter
MALSISQKAGWGLADMGIVVFVIIKQLLILSFLTNYLGVPIALAGLVTTSILVFDIFTDPIVGWLSDRSNTRWGRRAPWIVIGALIMVAGIIGLFAAPLGISPIEAAVWVGAFFLVATIGFTMVAIPYSATAGEMTESPSERSAMMAWRMGFASIGILIGGALIPVLAGDSREGFFSAALIVSPLILGSIWLSVFVTRHAPRVQTPSSLAPFDMVRLVIRNKSFVVLTILYGVMTLAVALITAGLPFAAIYLILDDGASALSGIAAGLGTMATMFAAFVVGSILSQAAWVWASKLLGKVIALTFGLMLYVSLLYVLYLSLPSVNVTAIAGMFVLAGMANGSYQQIPWAMYPDLMDVTRLQSGEAIEGAFSGIWLFGQKVANAFAPLLLSIFLANYGWRETTEGRVEQLPEAIAALLRSITLLPAAILVVAIFALILIYKPMAAKALR